MSFIHYLPFSFFGSVRLAAIRRSCGFMIRVIDLSAPAPESPLGVPTVALQADFENVAAKRQPNQGDIRLSWRESRRDFSKCGGQLI